MPPTQKLWCGGCGEETIEEGRCSLQLGGTEVGYCFGDLRLDGVGVLLLWLKFGLGRWMVC